MEPVTCTTCHLPFTPLADWVDLCPDCAADLDPDICENCGAPIVQNTSGARRRFCPDCARLNTNQWQREHQASRAKGEHPQWRASGWLNPGGRRPNAEEIADWLRLTWTDDQIVADLTAGYIPAGLVITGPAGISGMVCRDDSGALTVRRLYEVMR